MRIVLHVGPPKTGSTSIQGLLRQGRDAFAAHGVTVPPSRLPRMDEVFIATRRTFAPSRLLFRWQISSQDDLDRARPEMQEVVRGWVEQAAETLVLSHEALAGHPPEDLALLRDLLSEAADELRVVVALRRQDLFLNSMFKNAVRNAGARERAPTGTGPDYARMLDTLAQVFGESALRPFVFPDSAPGAADLMRDFCTAADLPRAALDAVPVARHNDGWDARALDLLRMVNHALPPMEDGLVRPRRNIVEQAIREVFPTREHPFHIGREAAQAVIAANAGTNAAVARRWFGREALFHDDMALYDQPTQDARPLDYARVIAQLARTIERERITVKMEQKARTEAAKRPPG